jgi:hypothetical protein
VLGNAAGHWGSVPVSVQGCGSGQGYWGRGAGVARTRRPVGRPHAAVISFAVFSSRGTAVYCAAEHE